MQNLNRLKWALLPATVLVSSASADDYLSPQEARKILFPQGESYQELALELSDETVSKIKELSGVRQRSKLPAVSKVTRGGRFLGWFIIDEVIGKHEFITFATALSKEGKVLGVEILSYRETHGGQVREESWRKNFIGKTLSDPLKLDSDIPNITGATLSCRNLADGVRRLLAFQKVVLNAQNI